MNLRAEPARDRRPPLILVAQLIAPFVLALLVAGTSANPLNVRYAIVSYQAFLVLGLGASDVQPPVIRALVLAAFVLSAVSLAQLYFAPRYAKEGCRSLATVLHAEATPDDLVLVNAATWRRPSRTTTAALPRCSAIPRSPRSRRSISRPRSPT